MFEAVVGPNHRNFKAFSGRNLAMVVKGLLARRAPPILILICLLTLWHTKLGHNVDLWCGVEHVCFSL